METVLIVLGYLILFFTFVMIGVISWHLVTKGEDDDELTDEDWQDLEDYREVYREREKG